MHLENNHRKMNKLEQIEILKAASSKYLLNDVIAGQNDPMCRLLPSVSYLNLTINSPGQAKEENSTSNNLNNQ